MLKRTIGWWFLLGTVLLVGCSTHVTRVTYSGSALPKIIETSPLISDVVVYDERAGGKPSDWLGAVRGGYGNVLKTLKTIGPAKLMVRAMYIEGLRKNGLYAGSDEAPFSLKVQLLKFDCSQYVNREAHAHVVVSLLDNKKNKTVFSKIYKTDNEEKAFFAVGIFGNVDTLRSLAESTMTQTVNKTLADFQVAGEIGVILKQSDAAIK